MVAYQNNIRNQTDYTPRAIVALYGHRLTILSDDVECAECGAEFEMPGLVQQSAAFRQVLYKLYIIGQFKRKDCGIDIGHLIEDAGDELRQNRSADYGYDHEWVHWSDSRPLVVDGDGLNEEQQDELKDKIRKAIER